jgi:hypothetical protein
VFAELKDPVRAKLERYELIGPLNPAHFFPTLDAALESFRQQTGRDWTPPAPTGAHSNAPAPRATPNASETHGPKR